MSADRGAHSPRRLSLGATLGELSFACLLVAVVTGVPLAVPFDIGRPYDSLAVMLLVNPAGGFFRNLHYWSAQLFLVLAVAHAWDHLRRRTETRPRRGVWARAVLTLPLGGFLLLSGFMLKGDAESQQAVRILSALLEQLPIAGRTLAALVLGVGESRQLLYIHHVATASLLTWLFVAEHARSLWPRMVTVMEMVAATTALSLALSPSLHEGLHPVLKGPWYFLGVQEALHWAARPVIVVALGLVPLVLLLLLPRLSARAADAARWSLAGALASYMVLTVVGVFFRGEAWAWGFAWEASSSGLVAHTPGIWWGVPVGSIDNRKIPVVLGRREGCLFCHVGVTGLSASHRPEAVGCASCHGGNPFTLHKATAHGGMRLVPGNLADADRSCGGSACHAGIPARVRSSLMTTMAGIVSVERDVWGGGIVGSSPNRRWGGRGADRPPRVAELGREGADSHLRQLCASCHLAPDKAEWGAIGETSRGGGCNACHLGYAPAAKRDLAVYTAAREPGVARAAPRTHPDVSIAIDGPRCFGCHSRSGRISTSYEGWHETLLDEPPRGDGRRYRTLEDGRVFAFAGADIHAEKGLVCVDCHTAREVMGDGREHARKWQPLRVGCEDCHPAVVVRTIARGELDGESRKILEVRELRGARLSAPHNAGPAGTRKPEADRKPEATHSGRFLLAGVAPGEPLLNTEVAPDGLAWLTTKTGGQRLPLRPPAAVCREGGGHGRLSCVSCHGAWAPRCAGCHTRFDPQARGVDLLDGRETKGAWIETGTLFSAQPPTLGIRLASATRAENRDSVDPFVPGMVLALDRNQAAGGTPDHLFRRLYARAFSHTISQGARSCTSCHNDPVALGYGEGQLRYEPEAAAGVRQRQVGRWRFTPSNPAGPDGLPADAWIGFLQERTAGASTRADVRPFSTEEQRRVLAVGACLTCHEPASRALRSAVSDWKGTLARVSPRCVLPVW